MLGDTMARRARQQVRARRRRAARSLPFFPSLLRAQVAAACDYHQPVSRIILNLATANDAALTTQRARAA